MTIDQWSDVGYRFGYALGYALGLTFCIGLPLAVLATIAVLVYRRRTRRQASSSS